MNINKLLTCLNQSTTEFNLLNVEKKDPYILDKIEVFNQKEDVNLQLNDTNKITSNLEMNSLGFANNSVLINNIVNNIKNNFFIFFDFMI